MSFPNFLILSACFLELECVILDLNLRKLIIGSHKFTNISRLRPFADHLTSLWSIRVLKFSSSQNCSNNLAFTEFVFLLSVYSPFLIVLDFLFITFLLYCFLSWTSSLLISSSAISASTLSNHVLLVLPTGLLPSTPYISSPSSHHFSSSYVRPYHLSLPLLTVLSGSSMSPPIFLSTKCCLWIMQWTWKIWGETYFILEATPFTVPVMAAASSHTM